MEQSDFSESIVSLVDDAVDQGLSRHTIEEVLQQEEQSVRKNRRVYSVFVYECSQPSCEESSSRLIDQMSLQCDVCEQSLRLSESANSGDMDRMQLRCEDHSTVRVHDFPIKETTCSIHSEPMKLIESYTTEEGLGGSG